MALSVRSDKARAEALFKKEGRLREGRKPMAEYEAEGQAIQEKIARLRALRLARDAAVATGIGVPAKRSTRADRR